MPTRVSCDTGPSLVASDPGASPDRKGEMLRFGKGQEITPWGKTERAAAAGESLPKPGKFGARLRPENLDPNDLRYRAPTRIPANLPGWDHCAEASVLRILEIDPSVSLTERGSEGPNSVPLAPQALL